MKKIFFLVAILFSNSIVAQTDTTFKIVWKENKCDTTTFNYPFLKQMREEEKAAIAYVSLYDSEECEWDGKADKEMTNLSCRIIKYLGLGYQCSDAHKNLLKKWLGKDTSTRVKEDLQYCPMTPNTAHSVNGINRINLTRMKNGSFKIYYEISGANIRSETSWEYAETIIFRKQNTSLIIISRKTDKYKKKKFKMDDE